MKRTRLAGVSARSGDMIDALCKAAAVKYWQEDQGTQAAVVEAAQEAYSEALTRLCRRVARLERAANKAPRIDPLAHRNGSVQRVCTCGQENPNWRCQKCGAT